jgi:obg-like ATPase 1
VEHVEGSVDPSRDFDIIKTELILKDLALMEGRVTDLAKKVRQNGKDKASKDLLDTATKVHAMLQEGKEIRFGDWKEKDIPYLNSLQVRFHHACIMRVHIHNTLRRRVWTVLAKLLLYLL